MASCWIGRLIAAEVASATTSASQPKLFFPQETGHTTAGTNSNNLNRSSSESFTTSSIFAPSSSPQRSLSISALAFPKNPHDSYKTTEELHESNVINKARGPNEQQVVVIIREGQYEAVEIYSLGDVVTGEVKDGVEYFTANSLPRRTLKLKFCAITRSDVDQRRFVVQESLFSKLIFGVCHAVDVDFWVKLLSCDNSTREKMLRFPNIGYSAGYFMRPARQMLASSKPFSESSNDISNLPHHQNILYYRGENSFLPDYYEEDGYSSFGVGRDKKSNDESQHVDRSGASLLSSFVKTPQQSQNSSLFLDGRRANWEPSIIRESDSVIDIFKTPVKKSSNVKNAPPASNSPRPSWLSLDRNNNKNQSNNHNDNSSIKNSEATISDTASAISKWPPWKSSGEEAKKEIGPRGRFVDSSQNTASFLAASLASSALFAFEVNNRPNANSNASANNSSFLNRSNGSSFLNQSSSSISFSNGNRPAYAESIPAIDRQYQRSAMPPKTVSILSPERQSPHQRDRAARTLESLVSMQPSEQFAETASMATPYRPWAIGASKSPMVTPNRSDETSSSLAARTVLAQLHLEEHMDNSKRELAHLNEQLQAERARVATLESDIAAARDASRLSSPEIAAAHKLVKIAQMRVRDLETKHQALLQMQYQLKHASS